MAAAKRRTWRIVVVVVLLVLASVLVFLGGWILPTATGYAAKNACSSVFIVGLDEDRIAREELAAMPYVGFTVDRDNRQVRATVLGVAARTSVYRPGLGCVLVIDSDPSALAAQGFDPPRAEKRDAPWPSGDAHDNRPEAEGLDREALDAAVAEIFEEPNPDSLRLTRAVVVVHGGRLVAERYGQGIEPSTPLLGWSMTKSVTNALVGVLVSRGKLDVQDPAPVAQWADDERSAVTIDQLLRMSSGLAFEEVYGPMTDATHMLFEVEDAAAIPLAMPLTEPPGTLFSYSSGTTNILSKIVRDQFTDMAEYHRFPYVALFVPLGMRSAVFETDAAGTFVGSSFMYATARDWARFGLLYLGDGTWDGHRILPEGWARYSGTATPTATHGEYAAHFWANAGAPDDGSGRKLPNVPPDAFYASGFQGQTVLIVPSRDAVVVRLGLTHDRAAWNLDAFASSVLGALPD